MRRRCGTFMDSDFVNTFLIVIFFTEPIVNFSECFQFFRQLPIFLTPTTFSARCQLSEAANFQFFISETGGGGPTRLCSIPALTETTVLEFESRISLQVVLLNNSFASRFWQLLESVCPWIKRPIQIPCQGIFICHNLLAICVWWVGHILIGSRRCQVDSSCRTMLKDVSQFKWSNRCSAGCALGVCVCELCVCVCVSGMASPALPGHVTALSADWPNLVWGKVMCWKSSIYVKITCVKTCIKCECHRALASLTHEMADRS